MPLLVRRLLALALLGALTACSHYRLGTPVAPAFETIFVAPVANASFAPQAGPLVTDSVRTTLARDGRLTLAAGPAEAGARLHIRLVRFDRQVLAARRDDTALARKFGATLTAEITLVDRSGKTLLDRREVKVSRDVFVDSGLQPTEYHTMPLLADALANEIAHAVLDTW